jgi:hypothetical protein
MSSGPSRRVVAGRAPRGRLDFGRLRFTRGVDVPRAASKSHDGSNHSEARRRLVTRCSLDQAGRVTRGRAGRIGGVVRAVHACIHLSPGADLADSAATRRGRSHGTEYHPDVKALGPGSVVDEASTDRGGGVAGINWRDAVVSANASKPPTRAASARQSAQEGTRWGRPR